MKSNHTQNEAEKLIDSFADKLLTLSDGNKIPTDWYIRLKLALTPKPKKTGRKRNYAQVSEVVKQLALASDNVRKPRTKHHNPATFKDEIATSNNVDRKTVERIDDDLPLYLSELGKLDDLEPQLRRAYIDGIAAVISEEIRNDIKMEDKTIEEAVRKRFPRLFSPDE